MLALGGKSHHTATFYGDMMSLGAAFAVVGYLQIGSHLRQTLPLFMYAFPVTLFGAVGLVCAAYYAESAVVGTTLQSYDSPTDSGAGIFDYLSTWGAFTHVLYLAAVPGLLGHTVINYLLK